MKKLFKNLLKPNNHQGDLLVEVMLATAVLAMVLTGGYVLSHRGLNSSVNADLRNQAQALAQGQIEHLVDAQREDPETLSNYIINGNPFCILPDGTVDTTDTDTNPEWVCPNYSGSIGVGVKYIAATQIFWVTARWNIVAGDPETDRTHLTYKDQLRLYYKLPVSFSANNISLNVYVRGKGKGSVVSDPSGINCSNKKYNPDSCVIAFNSTQSVTLTESSLGGIFQGWGGDCTGSAATCIVTVDRIKYVSVEFKAPSSSGGGGGCSTPCNCVQDGVGNWYCSGGSGGDTGGSGGTSGGDTGGGGNNTCQDFYNYPGNHPPLGPGNIFIKHLLPSIWPGFMYNFLFKPFFASPLCP